MRYKNKMLSVLIVISLVIGMIPGMGPVTAAEQESICTHEHDADCGYIEAEPCAHQHDDDCGGLLSGEGESDLLPTPPPAELEPPAEFAPPAELVPPVALKDTLGEILSQDTTVTTAQDFIQALESDISSTVTLGANITLTEASGWKWVDMRTSQILNTNGKTLTLTGSTGINLQAYALTVNGGGTVVINGDKRNAEAGFNCKSGAVLNLEDVTVNLQNTGISIANKSIKVDTVNVNSGATVNLDSDISSGMIYAGTLNINTGGKVDIKKFKDNGIYIYSGGTVHVNGGTLSVGKGGGYNQGILNNKDGLLKYSSGTLTGTTDGTISLAQGSMVEGLGGKLNNNGTDFTASGTVIVDVASAPASANGLSEGTYVYSSGKFMRPATAATVTTAQDLIKALESNISSTVTLGANIALTEESGWDWVDMRTSQILNTNGKTLTLTGIAGINLHARTLTVNGGGTVVINGDKSNAKAGFNCDPGAVLNLAGVTVNLQSTGNHKGINVDTVNVNSGATVNLDSAIGSGMIYADALNINTGGKVDIKNFSDTGIYIYKDSTVHVNGGTLNVGKGEGNNQGILNDSGGLLKYSSGTLTGTTGSTIFLAQGSKVEGLGGKLNNSGTDFTASGTVTVGVASAPVSASGLSEGIYVYSSGKFKRPATATTITTDADLIKALKSNISSTITLGGHITLTNWIKVGASHTLNTNGKTLTIDGNGGINFDAHVLTINGGGSVSIKCIDDSERLEGDLGGVLNLRNIKVNLQGKDSTGIWVETVNVDSNAEVNINSTTGGDLIYLNKTDALNINTGGKVYIKNFKGTGIDNGGTIHVNGGTLSVGKGEGNNRGIYNRNGGLLKYSSGTLTGTTDGTIFLEKGSKVAGLGGKLTDRGTNFTPSGIVTVGAASTPVSASGLSEGTYVYDSGRFIRPGISITAQPQDITVTEESITQSLSVTATASNNKLVSYQWYKKDPSGNSYTRIEGATSSIFEIPKDLQMGTYYFHCELSAEGYNSEFTRVVTVTVNMAPGNVGSIKVGGNTYQNAALAQNPKGTGWSWNNATNTLALTGDYIGEPIVIDCDVNDNIDLTYTGNATVNNNERSIRCKGNLTISGSTGTLALTGGSAAYGLYVEGALKITAGTVIVSAGSGIYTGKGLAVSGGSMTANATNGTGIVAYNGNVTVSGGSLTANVAAGTDFAIAPVNGVGMLVVSSGAVTMSNTANSNKLLLGGLTHTGGTVNGYAAGKLTGGSTTVSGTLSGAYAGNSVNSDASITQGSRNTYSHATGNTLTINSGNVTSKTDLDGGYSSRAGENAMGNTLVLNGSDFSGGQVFLTGGNAIGGNATGNTVNISGFSGTLSNVYGGYSHGGNATDNTVNISDSPNLSVAALMGGCDGMSQGDLFTGNTLNLHTSGVTATKVANFENIQFYLPVNTANKTTMLTATTATDLTNVVVSMAFDSTAPTLKSGNVITLIDGVTGTFVAKSVVVGSYAFTLSVDKGKLIATMNPTSNNVKSITIAPADPTVIAGKTIQLTATVSPDNVNQAVKWSSSNTAIATVDETTGLVTGVKTGSVTIKATSAVEASVSKSVTLKVIAAPNVTPTIVQQPESKTVFTGETAAFTIEAHTHATYPGNLTYQWQKLTGGTEWTNIDGATAASYETDTLDSSNNGIKFRCIVTNTYNDKVDGAFKSDAISNTATLTVLADAEIPQITKQPQEQTAAVGKTATFTVVATSPDGGRLSYQWWKSADSTTWAEIDGATAASYTTDVLILDDNNSTFKCVITNAKNGKTATEASSTATLTVINPFTSITLNKRELRLDKNETETLIATVTPSATTDTIIWSSGDSEIATVSNNGLVTATANEGTTTITAKSTLDWSVYAVCVVTVLADPPAFDIQIEATGVTIDKYGRILDSLYELDGTTKKMIELTASPASTWTSSDKKVASIDKNSGVVKYLSSGVTTIKATEKVGTGEKGAKKTTSIVLTIKDITPKLPAATIKVNTKSTYGTEFKVLPSDNYKFDEVEINGYVNSKKAIVGITPGSNDADMAKGLVIDKVDDTTYRIYSDSAIVTKAVTKGKVVLSLCVKKDGEPITKDLRLTVNVVVDTPKPTLKLPKLNTFLIKDSGKVTVTNLASLPKIDRMELVASGVTADGDVTENFKLSADATLSFADARTVTNPFASTTTAKTPATAVKGKINVFYEGYADPYPVAVTIPIGETKPKLTLKPASHTINPDYGLNATFEVIGGEVKSVKKATDAAGKDLKANEHIKGDVTNNDNLLLVEMKGTALTTNNLQINVWLDNAVKEILVKPVVKTEKKDTTYKLSTATVTLNSARAVAQEQLVQIIPSQTNVSVVLTDNDISAQKPADTPDTIKVTAKNNQVKVEVSKDTKPGTYKYDITPNGITKPIVLTVKVDGKAQNVNAAVKASGNIDLMNRGNTKIIYTPTIKGTTSPIVKVEPIENNWTNKNKVNPYADDYKNFSVIWNDETKKVEVMTTVDEDTGEPLNYKKGASYKMQFKFTLENGDEVTTADVMLRPTQNAVKHNHIPKLTTMYQSRTGAAFIETIDLTATSPVGARIVGIDFKTNPNNAYGFYFDEGTQKLHIWIRDNSLAKLGKVTPVLAVTYEGQGMETFTSGGKPVTAPKAIDIKIPLNVLR